MPEAVQSVKVKAVQEPGYANVWSVQTETGASVARMTVDANAEAWAKRIESALNAKSTGELNKTVATQKWITGKNLFMGIESHHGIAVRNAYGPVAFEIPLRLGDKLNWTALDGSQVDSLSQALRNTVKRGLVRRGSHFYNAICMVAPLAR